MRTMFPSQEKNGKKTFQKPNILRKRSKKPIKVNTSNKAIESPDKDSLVNKNCVKDVEENHIELETVDTLYSITQSDLDVSVETEIGYANCDVAEENTSVKENTELDLKMEDPLLKDRAPLKVEEIEANDNSNPELVNIESFFNESAGEKYMLFDIEPGKQIETLVVIDNESLENEMYVEEHQNVITNMVPLSAVTNQPQETNDEDVTSTLSFPNLYSQFPLSVKFKCDVPNCTKEFRSEQKFKKHKNSHEKDGSIKAPRQVTVECPVKKVDADGTEKGCGKIFLIRDQLLKHLNEDHTLDDAVYRCEECGRRFFWASGLRAHVRAHCRRAAGATAAGAGAGATAAGGAGGGLVCGWPGCGRVFRQPCRLREHARAHTGDRPYPCQYPNCGWSFRSASKLVRHARRHTGERRHACAACGRAFLRREHLRDHAARHHAPHKRRAQLCAHPGCEQTFNNMSTLYLHMKKVHKKKDPIAPATATTDTLYTVPDNMFMVSLAPEPTQAIESCQAPEPSPAVAEESVRASEDEAEDEWHSARTHCTWPLERAQLLAVEPADSLLKDDSQVEPEGSESNTFTVRSDLFLHGNVLINEDSEHMGVSGSGDALGGDLGLLDAHPTIDLMQEELMYADTATDESSFRIFLLSGEELT